MAVISMVGPFSRPFGLGEACRRLEHGLRRAGHTVHRVDYLPGQPVRGRDRRLAPLRLFMLNGPELVSFNDAVGPDAMAAGTNIGYWWWEVPGLPAAWREALPLLDEVWVGSTYVRACLGDLGLPVSLVPLPLLDDRDPATALPATDRPFTFLHVSDFRSTAARKNPDGAVRAFLAAFPEPGAAHLVMKTLNGRQFPERMEALRALAAGRPDVEFRDGALPGPEQDALVAAADCIVSLHRSEGLGLVLLQAMARGQLALATRYSGNLDFMTEANSLLVGWRPGVVPGDAPPYPPGTPWAEPDLADAARAMRAAAQRRPEDEARRSQARSDVRALYGLEASMRAAAARLAAVDRSPGRRLLARRRFTVRARERLAHLLGPHPRLLRAAEAADRAVLRLRRR